MAGTSRRVGTLAGIVVVLAALLLSNRFGRAEPTNDYRPDLPPAALATGCYPLPHGATLDFAHQVRSDRDVETGDGPRRVLVGQYDQIDADVALGRIVDEFAAVGYVAARGPAPYDAVLRRPDGPDGTDEPDEVRVIVEQLDGIDDDTVVRGWFQLDLPVAARASDARVCGQLSSTKRWGSR